MQKFGPEPKLRPEAAFKEKLPVCFQANEIHLLPAISFPLLTGCFATYDLLDTYNWHGKSKRVRKDIVYINKLLIFVVSK